MAYVGKNIPHDSARGHVTGGSRYIDDLPPLSSDAAQLTALTEPAAPSVADGE